MCLLQQARDSRFSRNLKGLYLKIATNTSVFSERYPVFFGYGGRTEAEYGCCAQHGIHGAAYDTLKDLAKECVAGRGEITRLEEENFRLSRLLRDKLRIIQSLENQLRELQEKCKPYLQALEHFPDLIRAFMEELRYSFDLRQRQEEQRKQSAQKKNYRNSDRDISR